MRRLISLAGALALSLPALAAVPAPLAHDTQLQRHGVKCAWVPYPDGSYHYVCARGV